MKTTILLAAFLSGCIQLKTHEPVDDGFAARIEAGCSDEAECHKLNFDASTRYMNCGEEKGPCDAANRDRKAAAAAVEAFEKRDIAKRNAVSKARQKAAEEQRAQIKREEKEASEKKETARVAEREEKERAFKAQMCSNDRDRRLSLKKQDDAINGPRNARVDVLNAWAQAHCKPTMKKTYVQRPYVDKNGFQRVGMFEDGAINVVNCESKGRPAELKDYDGQITIEELVPESTLGAGYGLINQSCAELDAAAMADTK